MKKIQIKKIVCSKNSGFSLIEVVVTMAILSVSITAMSTLMASNIGKTQSAKNQIIASMLAQEAIELVRNLRDNRSTSFSTFVNGKGTTSFRIDETVVNDLDTSNAYLLYLNGGFYTHNPAGTATRFYRMLILTPDTTNKQTVANAYVGWDNSGIFPPNLANCNMANKCVSLVSVFPDKN